MVEISDKYLPQAKKKCCECESEFDMLNEIDAQEWHYGHDCEAQ